MTRFGLLVPHFGDEADQDLLIEGARLADRLGFDSLWVRDHLVFHPHGMEGTDRTFIEPFVTLTYLAAVTERIGLGAATIIPFRHPIHMAYSVASMSWITRRPFDLGIGAGNFQHEFDVIGQGDVKRPEMMREQTLIARELWAGETRRVAQRAVRLRGRRPQAAAAPSRCRSGGAARRRPRPGSRSTSARAGCPGGSRSRPTRRASPRSASMAAEQGKTPVLVGAVPVTSIDDSFARGDRPDERPGPDQERQRTRSSGSSRRAASSRRSRSSTARSWPARRTTSCAASSATRRSAATC